MFSPPWRGGKYTAVVPQGFVRGTFPFVTDSPSSPSPWRAAPANVLTFCNMGSGALVAWWAASEFDLGWAAAEWAASIGIDGTLMTLFGTTERRVMGLGWMLIVWMFGQLCDVLDGPVARKMGASGQQGAWLDSMADLISGGLAPAFVGLSLMSEWSASATGVAWGAGAMWVQGAPLLVLPAAAWRLARYAGESAGDQPKGPSVGLDFEGIPAPMAALYWAGLLAMWAVWPSGHSTEWLWWSGCVGGTLLPLWMVSRWPQLGLKTWGRSAVLDRGRIFWLCTACLCLGFGGGVGPMLALLSYPLTGALLHRMHSKKQTHGLPRRH